MPGANPLVEDMPGDIPSMFGASGSVSAAGASLGGAVGAGPNVEGEHNTHLYVAGVMIFALAVVIALHISGFRFATDVGVTRG